MVELYIIKNGIHSFLKEFNNEKEANSYIKSCELSPRRKQMAKKEGRRIYNKRTPLFDCDNHYIKTNEKQENIQTAIITLGSSLSGNVSVNFIEGPAVLMLYPKRNVNSYLSQYQKNSIFARSIKIKINDELKEKYKNEVILDINITKVFGVKEEAGNYIQNIEFSIIPNERQKVMNELLGNIIKKVYNTTTENTYKYTFKDNKKKAIIIVCIKLLDKITKSFNNFRNKLNSML